MTQDIAEKLWDIRHQTRKKHGIGGYCSLNTKEGKKQFRESVQRQVKYAIDNNKIPCEEAFYEAIKG